LGLYLLNPVCICLQLLDEPSLGPAPKIVQEIFSVIWQLRDLEVTILLVEQNASLALQTADRVCVLESGQIKLSGATAELLQDEQIRRAYLG